MKNIDNFGLSTKDDCICVRYKKIVVIYIVSGELRLNVFLNPIDYNIKVDEL